MKIKGISGAIVILLLMAANTLCAQDIVKVKGVQGR